LEIKNLKFGYKGGALLYDDFSLSVKKGEVVTIVGESGSGKSTLFGLVTDDLKPIDGEIKVIGKVAQIYQDPYRSFHPSYSIISQIKEVSDLDGLDEFLNKLDLDKNLLDKKPHQLSGGQLQRCSILRALLMKADLILADEPTSALDNVVQLDVMKLLVGFLDRIGILLITHDSDLAQWASDKIISLTPKVA
jgi:peptide/nickel transport system ATP-binding protein